MRLASTAALSSLLLVAACDGGGLDSFGAGPSRPEVSVAKEVTMVSATELVGTWTCRELNPYPDQPEITSTITINADGTMSSEALLPMADTMPGAPDMVMTMAGEWQIEGDRLITSNSEVDMVAADGSEGGMASLMSSAAEFMSDQTTDGTSEIFRITASDLVMRGDDPDAPTIACQRQG